LVRTTAKQNYSPSVPSVVMICGCHHSV